MFWTPSLARTKPSPRERTRACKLGPRACAGDRARSRAHPEGAAGKILGTGMAPAMDYNDTTRATTKGFAANEHPLQHIMAAHGKKVWRTGQISGTSTLRQDATT